MKTVYCHVMKTWENMGNACIMLEKSNMYNCMYTDYNYGKYCKEKWAILKYGAHRIGKPHAK